MDELRLRPAERPRAPAWKLGDDYDVMFEGKRVGRIRYHEESTEGRMGTPWFWGVDKGANQKHGNVATLEEAKAAFRKAWA